MSTTDPTRVRICTDVMQHTGASRGVAHNVLHLLCKAKLLTRVRFGVYQATPEPEAANG